MLGALPSMTPPTLVKGCSNCGLVPQPASHKMFRLGIVRTKYSDKIRGGENNRLS